MSKISKNKKNVLMAALAVLLMGVIMVGANNSGRFSMASIDGWTYQMVEPVPSTDGWTYQAAPTLTQNDCITAKSYYNAGVWTGQAEKNFGFNGKDCSDLYGRIFWDSITQVAPTLTQNDCITAKSYYDSGAWTGQAEKNFGFNGKDCSDLYGRTFWDSITQVAPTPSKDECTTLKSYYNAGVWTGQPGNAHEATGRACVTAYGRTFWDSITKVAPTPDQDACRLAKSYYNAGVWTGQASIQFSFDGYDCVNQYGKTFWESIVEKTTLPTSAPVTQPVQKSTCTNFTDVSQDDAHFEAIQYVKNKGIFKGYPGCTFMPGANINRGELIKVLVSVFGLTGKVGVSSHFTDVEVGDWFFRPIEIAYLNKIVKGYSDGHFLPGKAVSNAETAKMLVSAAKINVAKYETDLRYCTNLTPEQKKLWYYPYMAALAVKGAMSNTNCQPTENTTRAEVAEILYQLKK